MSPSSIDNELEEVADMFDSIGDHRVIVAAATLDEMDRKPSDEVDIADVSVSVADTEHADNTHPYLMRYADIYAHSQEFSDPDEVSKAGNTKFIKISRSTDQGDFKKGEVVIYHDKETNTSYEATIVDVHYDERKQPHYDLMFKGDNNDNSDGKEDTVRLSVKDGIKQQPKTLEAVSETTCSLTETNAVKCVNFEINPTPLFVAMYNGEWEAAQKRLRTHPEEASVWVARYNTNADDIKVFRWRLLPLHLCVALSGSNDDDDDKVAHEEAAATDVPDDEKDELDHKENVQRSPPRTLLVALLKVYPQATQCTDDQNLIPLHSAIRGNASLSVVQELLEVDPSSVNCKDSRGRNAHLLAKKVFGKRRSDSYASKMKYERLKALLHLAGTHPDAQLKEEQQKYETRLNKLENENLSLRRDNALLRTRCERNEDLLEKLVYKLQEYQQKLGGNSSTGVESNDGGMVEVVEDFSRMDSIPPPPPATLPAIDNDDIAENWKVAFDANKCKDYYFNKKTRVVTWVKPKCLEENEEEPVDSEDKGDKDVGDEEEKTGNKVLGGRGAYAKRIERHIQKTMSYEKTDDALATPMSAQTGSTEMSTPETWEGRNLALELESFDEDDEDKPNKPFMADLSETSSGEIVQDISSSAIFRLSSHTDKDSVPFDMGKYESTLSFTNAGAFTYSDIVKVGDAEKEASENAQEKPKPRPRVTFKDVPSAPEKKVKPVNPAISAEIERLRRKFSEES